MRPPLLALIATAMLAVTACGAGATGTTATPTPRVTPDAATRPASPAVLRIVSPADGAVVTARTVHVVVSLQNATVVQATSSHVVPDQGHVHLYLDNQLIYMAYQLAQDVPVQPGVYSLKAEFVGSDHFPFNPRVWSTAVIFTVR